MREFLRTRSADVMLAGVVLAAIVVAVGIVVSRPTDAEQAAHVAKQTAMARRWADTLTIRVRGLSCDASGNGRCTIVPDVGAPFVAVCSPVACSLEACRGAP